MEDRYHHLRNNLRASLDVLAMTGADQLSHLDGLADFPVSTDELALEYYELLLLAKQHPNELGIANRLSEFLRLDAMLADMSGEENAELWAPEAILSAPEWEAVRKQAVVCLAVLDRTKNRPQAQNQD